MSTHCRHCGFERMWMRHRAAFEPHVCRIYLRPDERKLPVMWPVFAVMLLVKFLAEVIK